MPATARAASPRATIGALALVVLGKAERLCRFHQNTLMALKELVQAAGLADPSLVTAARIVRRSAEQSVKLLANLLPFVAPGEWLRGEMSQQVFRSYWSIAQPQGFSVARPVQARAERLRPAPSCR